MEIKEGDVVVIRKDTKCLFTETGHQDEIIEAGSIGLVVNVRGAHECANEEAYTKVYSYKNYLSIQIDDTDKRAILLDKQVFVIDHITPMEFIRSDIVEAGNFLNSSLALLIEAVNKLMPKETENV